jgi:hypothetical protein
MLLLMMAVGGDDSDIMAMYICIGRRHCQLTINTCTCTIHVYVIILSYIYIGKCYQFPPGRAGSQIVCLYCECAV